MNSKQFLSRGRLATLLAISVAILAIVSWRLNADTTIRTPAEIEDYLFWEAKELTAFHLEATDNKDFNLKNLEGKWSFIFFGYTHCPDVCPATLNVMSSSFSILARDPIIASEIQGVFISVDPKRDTPELLKKYVSYFNDSFSGITGSKAQLDAFTRQIGALYFMNSENGDNTSYDVTHNSTIFLIDPRGRLYGRFSAPQNPQVIADVFIRIRAFYNKQAEKQWLFFQGS